MFSFIEKQKAQIKHENNNLTRSHSSLPQSYHQISWLL